MHNSLTKVVRFCLKLGYYIHYADGRISMRSKEHQEHFTLTPLQLKYLIADVPLQEHNFPEKTIYIHKFELADDTNSLTPSIDTIP